MALALAGCTEEARNQFFRSADNVLGKDYKVSYVDEGQGCEILDNQGW